MRRRASVPGLPATAIGHRAICGAGDADVGHSCDNWRLPAHPAPSPGRVIDVRKVLVLRVITIGMTALAIGSLASPASAQTAPPSRPAPAPAPAPEADDDAGPDVVVEGK